jgi:hypothetical protein
LGDLISADGTNTKNIKARKDKGFGIVDQIISMLTDICFGPHFFQVALVLRSSLFINSILLNSEVWYGLSKTDIENFETVDNSLLKRILEAPCTTPTPMLFLELGCIPIRYIIISRRIMYLQYLLKQKEDSLLYKVFKAQMENPSKDDWTTQVEKDLDEIDLNISMESMKMMTKEEFSKKVRSAVNKAALKFLTIEKRKRSKVKEVNHDNLTMQNYLSPNGLELKQAKLLFQLRSRMLDVRTNFGNKYDDVLCPLCKEKPDTQQHVLEFSVLIQNTNLITVSTVVYSDIFESDIQDVATECLATECLVT